MKILIYGAEVIGNAIGLASGMSDAQTRLPQAAVGG